MKGRFLDQTFDLFSGSIMPQYDCSITIFCKNPHRQTWLLPQEMVKESEAPSFLSDLHAAPTLRTHPSSEHLGSNPAPRSLGPPSVPFLGHSLAGGFLPSTRSSFPLRLHHLQTKQMPCDSGLNSIPPKSIFRPVCSGIQLKVFFLSVMETLTQTCTKMPWLRLQQKPF